MTKDHVIPLAKQAWPNATAPQWFEERAENFAKFAALVTAAQSALLDPAKEIELAASQAREKALREILGAAYSVAVDHDDRLPFDWAVYCEGLFMAREFPSDDSALCEYGARLIEKVAGMTLSTYSLKTIAALVREGAFK